MIENKKFFNFPHNLLKFDVGGGGMRATRGACPFLKKACSLLLGGGKQKLEVHPVLQFSDSEQI